MAASKIKPLALAFALFAFSGPASAQQMERADGVAAGAVWAQKLSVSEMIDYCQGYVAPVVKDQLGLVLDNWNEVNQRYLAITDKIRLEMIKSVIRANGQTAAADFVKSMEAKDEMGRAGVRASLDQTPAAQRENKCYGIIVAINQGQFDVGIALTDDAKHLEARAPVMGW